MKKIMALLVVALTTILPTVFGETKAKAPENFTVILDWFANPDHAPLFVAQQQGYFKQQGLNVKFITPADPADPAKLVAAHKADIALDYQPHVLIERAQHLPITQVGTLIATPLNGLTVLADGPIKDIKDLKGKKVGYSTSGIDTSMLQVMLEKQGLNLRDVQLINVHYGLTQALLTKKVDAVTGMMRNFEPIQMQLVGHPARVFYPEEFGMPPYDELVYIAHKNNKDDPRIARFLYAVEQGVQYLVNNPQTSWQIFAKQHPELNNTLNQRAWFATLSRFALRPAAKDPQRCQALAEYLLRSQKMKIDVEHVCSTQD